MKKLVLTIVMLSVLAFGVVIVFLGLKFGSPVVRLWQGDRLKNSAPVVVRRPNSPTPPSSAKHTTQTGRQNLALLATVSVSSNEETNSQSAQGVADDVLDGKEWVASGETVGAWIKLTWEHPVTVTEIDLYDLSNPRDNVQRGTLSFDDGSSLLVSALPADGGAWRVSFPPKTVHWAMFQIDGVEGTRTGLAEFVVVGVSNY